MIVAKVPGERLRVLIMEGRLTLRVLKLGFALIAFSAGSALAQQTAPDPLSSWNDGATKQAIVKFVTNVTKEGGTDFVTPAGALSRSTMTARYGLSSPCTSNLPSP